MWGRREREGVPGRRVICLWVEVVLSFISIPFQLPITSYFFIQHSSFLLLIADKGRTPIFYELRGVASCTPYKEIDCGHKNTLPKLNHSSHGSHDNIHERKKLGKFCVLQTHSLSASCTYSAALNFKCFWFWQASQDRRHRVYARSSAVFVCNFSYIFHPHHRLLLAFCCC